MIISLYVVPNRMNCGVASGYPCFLTFFYFFFLQSRLHSYLSYLPPYIRAL